MMKMKYSVVLATLATDGGDVWKKDREVLETVAHAGFDCVEIDAEPDRIPRQRYKEVTEIATSLGLKIASLLGAWGGSHAGEDRDLASTDEAVRANAVGYAKKCVDLAADFGRPVFGVGCCPFRPVYPSCPVPLEVVRRNFIKSVQEVAEYAAQKQVPLALEGINRFEAYPGFMNHVSDVAGVIDEIGGDNLGVLADLFHINIEDASVTDALLLAGRRLMHIHLSDSNHMAPGTAHIDFLQLIRTLRGIGYQGYMSLNCMPVKPDWRTLLQRSIRYMKQLEEASLPVV